MSPYCEWTASHDPVYARQIAALPARYEQKVEKEVDPVEAFIRKHEETIVGDSFWRDFSAAIIAKIEMKK